MPALCSIRLDAQAIITIPGRSGYPCLIASRLVGWFWWNRQIVTIKNVIEEYSRLKIAYEIGVIESRMFAENCYIAHLNGLQECLVVDPGLDPGEILDYLESKGLTPAAILNTHGHADHIAGNGVLK
jgi:hypothetical protein